MTQENPNKKRREKKPIKITTKSETHKTRPVDTRDTKKNNQTIFCPRNSCRVDSICFCLVQQENRKIKAKTHQQRNISF